MNWIQSEGGPLLGIGKEIVGLWRGIAGSSFLGKNNYKNTDYDRACEIKDYIGIIPVDNYQAIVFGDMPLSTTIIKNRKNIHVIRAFFMDPDPDINIIFRKYLYSDSINQVESINVNLPYNSILIFDSAIPGSEISEEYIEVSIDSGKYTVKTNEFNPDKRTSLLIHDFIRNPD